MKNIYIDMVNNLAKTLDSVVLKDFTKNNRISVSINKVTWSVLTPVYGHGDTLEEACEDYINILLAVDNIIYDTTKKISKENILGSKKNAFTVNERFRTKALDRLKYLLDNNHCQVLRIVSSVDFPLPTGRMFDLHCDAKGKLFIRSHDETCQDVLYLYVNEDGLTDGIIVDDYIFHCPEFEKAIRDCIRIIDNRPITKSNKVYYKLLENYLCECEVKIQHIKTERDLAHSGDSYSVDGAVCNLHCTDEGQLFKINIRGEKQLLSLDSNSMTLYRYWAFGGVRSIFKFCEDCDREYVQEFFENGGV